MSERIDYYMTEDEKETNLRALRIALAHVRLQAATEDIIYDDDRMGPLERFEIQLINLIEQFDR